MFDRKVAIVGAGGVGATIAYALMQGGIARHISLFDVNADKARAEVLDLSHGVQFTPAVAVDGGDDLSVIAGADIVVVTAGAKQKQGETRLDLAQRNFDIFTSLVPDVVANAPDAMLLIVTNPVDVLTYAALKISGLDPSRVIGSGTVLDTSRLRFLLAERCDVAISNVHATVVGEHGDSEFALWSRAVIGHVPLTDWTLPGGSSLGSAELTNIEQAVIGAAYEVIRGKGATTYAVGLAVASIVSAILDDTRQILPVSTLRGTDVCYSLPTVLGASGAVPLDSAPMSEDEQRRLAQSADAIRATIRSLGL